MSSRRIHSRDVVNTSRTALTLLALLSFAAPLWAGPTLTAVVTTTERAGMAHQNFLEARRNHLITSNDPYLAPPVAKVVEEPPAPWKTQRYPWRYQIRATVFWVGEQPTRRNPTSNVASSWDPNWQANFGGFDHPFKRDGYRPAAFAPKQNPFYVALPYNDMNKQGRHRPEASRVIPWYWTSYKGPSVSLCEGRWIAIHSEGKVCYAQWKDVGPFSTDDWPYVFGGERPRPNPNQNAGIDVSPAVRDFLTLKGDAEVDWRFVEDHQVPDGPWRWYPQNGNQASTRK